MIILNDDPLPTVSLGGFAAPEGTGGSTVWEMPVTLSAPSALPVTVTVDFATVDSNPNPLVAQAGSDFTSASGVVTFAPGETIQNVEIEILGDAVDEPALYIGEWWLVAFSNATNAVLDTSFFGLGLFIIVDDD